MKKQEKKTKKKTKSEERDVVLRVAVTAMIVWMIFGGIVFAIGVMNPREDPRAGLARLEQMEAADTRSTARSRRSKRQSGRRTRPGPTAL